MRKFYCLSTLVLALLLCKTTRSQDFSNKGREFWLAYSYHVGMTGAPGNYPTMTLYITTDVATTYTVEIYGGATLQSGPIAANQVIPVIIPTTYFVNDNGLFTGRTIRVTAVKPVAVYSFITRSAASAATLCLPVNVLGKEYYASSYTQVSNENSSNGYITIIAVENDTKVEITPTATTKNGWTAGNTYTVLLNKGEIYQVLGATSGLNGSDLTGTYIKSVAGATGGCKKVAVYSGSGKLMILTPGCGANSSDNLYQQLYPLSSWGKKFLTAPSYNRPNNYYRIIRSDPTTNVSVNGVAIAPASFVNNYVQLYNNTPNLIEADKPISVAQYFTTQGCAGNPAPYDPDMIMLNPVEQNIDKVTLQNTPLTATPISQHQHHIQVIMKNSGNGINSFTLDGNPVPPAQWVVHPQDNNYSYVYLPFVAAGNHRIQSDSGFNALAYGYGAAETYGYSAGTNVKDIYQQILVQTEYGIEPTPSVCRGAPFKFKVSLPYCADSLYWDLSQLPAPAPPNVWVHYTTCIPGPGGPDSTTVVNGKTIYWYSLPTLYSFPVNGVYPVVITAYAPNTDGCGNEQEIPFDLTISDPPVPDFIFSTTKCVAEPVQFTETTPQTPKPTYSFWWDFGDPASGAANNSNLRNPVHTFSAPGTYNVRYASITTPGCLSDTITKQVTIATMPTATITGNNDVCVGATPPTVTFTGTGGTGDYIFYYHINTGPATSISSSGSPTAMITVPTGSAGTFTYYLDSVRNVGSTLCKTNSTGSVVVNVRDNATINLTSAAGSNSQTLCVNVAITNITYNIGGGGLNGNVTGLPTGVTGTYAGGVFTISGTPTVTGTFNYTVNTTGVCTQTSASGTITVNPNATINLASGSSTQTVCINTPITTITYNVGGGGTGATIVGLPSGVTGTYSGGVFTISGTPTVSGTFNFTINTSGTCAQASAAGSITVNPEGSVSLSSGTGSNNPTVCINVAIPNITYALAGAATGATVVGLPAGVTANLVGSTYTISGTPTVAGTFPFTVNATGAPCGVSSAAGTITVNPNASINLTGGSNTQGVCVSNAIATITYTIGGGGTGATVTGLPAGVTGTYAGGVFTISGTPTATGTFNYTVNTSGTCLQANATGTITVSANSTLTLTSAASTTNQSLCVNIAIANITYSVGGAGSGATVTGLPAGVTGTYSGGVFTISGTPTASGTFNYSVTTSGGTCVQGTLSGTITVNPDATLNLTSANNTQSVCINTAIASITYNVGGGGTGATVTGLPAGVTGTYAGGILTISGTPTATGTFNFTVNTTGTCVQANAAGTITVNANSTLTLTSAAGTTNQSLCINIAISNITYAVGGAGSGATVTGLPAGVTGTYSGGVFTISGTPTAAGTFNYSVTTSGGSCAQGTLNGTITVNPDATLNLNSANNNQNVCINTAIVNITYNVGGGGTGATVTGLPAGVTGTFSGGVLTISGSPSANGTFNFTVNTTGTCVQTSATGTLTVTPNATLSLTSAPSTSNQTVCVNVAITNITYSVAGSGTGGTVVGLPAGVTGSFSGGVFTISGTPTVSGTFNYTVNTTGSCGNATGNGTITVNADATINLTSAAPTAAQEICVNSPLTNITYSIGGGGTGATVSGLPAGVNGTFAGGVFTITGSPTVTGTFNYTVQTTGPCIKPTMSGTITVNALPTGNFSSSTPSCETRTISFTDLSIPNVGTVNSWSWNFGDPSSGAANTSNLQNPTHTFAAAGTYSVTLTVTNSKGCTSAVYTGSVTINARPRTDFTTPVVCNSDIAAFTDASTIATGTITGWQWNFGDPGSGPLNTSTLQNPTHAFVTAGPYTVQLITTSNSGCRDTTTHTFTVNGTPTANFNMQTPASICSNLDVKLTDASTVSFGNITKIEVYWDYTNDPTIKTVDNTPTAAELYTHLYPEFGTPFTKTVQIRYVAYTGINCISTKTMDITLLATPSLTFTPVPYACSDALPFQITQAQLTNGLPGGPGVFSGNGVSPTGLFTPQTAGTGSHVIRYTYTGTNGCTNYKEQTIDVFPAPPTNAGPDKVVLEGGQVTLTPAANAGLIVTYSWSPATYIVNPNVANAVVVSPLTDMTYTLTVTTDKGCSNDDMVNVKLLKAPMIPNIFSPNGDGIHDKWDIAFLDTYPGCTVDIFSRYGQLIYHSEGYSKPWDGTVNGKPVPVGTYYYIINPKNGRQQYSGYVDVIR